jgi:hypothetical protein
MGEVLPIAALLQCESHYKLAAGIDVRRVKMKSWERIGAVIGFEVDWFQTRLVSAVVGVDSAFHYGVMPMLLIFIGKD